METISLRSTSRKRNSVWGRKTLALLLTLAVLIGQLFPAPYAANAAAADTGATFFTGTDNWRGGLATSTADGDMDVSVKNGDSIYPIEFKITGVKKPTKSAHLLIRANDVDEYDPTNAAANGEWDRVYISSNPSDIALGAATTAWPSNFGSATYQKEFPKAKLVGALSGQNEKWNTTTFEIKEDRWDEIVDGQDLFVGISVHHYFLATGSFNSGWVTTIDWGQLVIDGGPKTAAEITKAGVTIGTNKVTLDTEFMPKTNGNFRMEVSVTQETNYGTEIVEQNVGLSEKSFLNSTLGESQSWSKIEFTVPGASTSKEYKVNYILFDNTTGIAQHIYSLSSLDPEVKDIAKAGAQYLPTSFTVSDFSSKYNNLAGTPQPDKLEEVKIVTLPTGGKLQLDGVDVAIGAEIPKADLDKLAFVPDASGFTGAASFKWNGYDGEQYAAIDATVTITANAAPVVTEMTKQINQGSTLIFAPDDFKNHYTDATLPKEELSKIKIISLPAASLGTLWFKDGANPAVEVTVGTEINSADLGKLSFVPNGNAVGTAAFEWNASDGKQYAKDNEKVKITINAAPIVSDIAFADIAGRTISFKAVDFANADAYTDAENDALTQVRITLPADFASKGKLKYTDGITEKEVAPNTPTILNQTMLNTLKFVPAVDLAENSTVVFNWEGYDGNQYSLASAQVDITYTNDPVVGNIAKTGLQYETISFTADEFKNRYSKQNGDADASGLKSVKIVTLPIVEQGVLLLNGSPVAAGDLIAIADIAELTFVPASSGFTGIANFDWNGENADGKYAALNAAVTITANAAPTVDPINKSILKGESLSFAIADFTTPYSDTNEENLDKVKLVTLPDPSKGKLVLQNGPGSAIEITTAGFEIDVEDLAKLEFIPASGATGAVTFDWNGSDGNQYAKDNKQITITINTPPVVGDINKTGLSGTVIDFKASDFTDSPRYTDADGDLLSTVSITLPGSFSDSGQLWYTSTVGESVYVTPLTTAVIAKDRLDSLKFMPSALLAEGSAVTFNWNASDGKQFSEAPAAVYIDYNGRPVAEPIVVNVVEGSTEIIITLKGLDPETVTGIVYGLDSNPSKGTLRPADDDVSGDTWIYTPGPDFISGQDSFTYSVTDSEGQTSNTPATVTINIHRALDGWAGDKAQGDSKAMNIIPGEQLKLSAISSLLAEKVTANVNGEIVELTLANQATFAADGYKLWENSTYLLPAETLPNQYMVTYHAEDILGASLPSEWSARLTDNYFAVVRAELALTANPDKILGDGKSTTDLTAQLKNADGTPIVGVTVVFTAPVGKGEFVGPNTAVTDAQGIATVTYRSEQITGVAEQFIPIQANVYNKELGLKAQEEVIITFLPAAVKGFITKGESNTPVAGASIRVTLDLNKDGIIDSNDFDETVVTDASGAYYVIVPKGDVSYDLEVSQIVDVGGVPTPITYKQKAQVGEVTGTGEENFDSEKTVTGIVLLKQPDGETSLFSGAMLASTVLYLKNVDGSYVTEGGAPKVFNLTGPGVFNAEGLAIGDYELEIKYEIEPGKFITFGHAAVSVTASGEMNITEALVDPYGTITDANTKAVIKDAKVVLHYADTARNKAKGITVNGEVILPALVGFAPNDNASPVQLSDEHGFYAYMVYPETDYYLVVTKPGYYTYISPNLAVEWEIVRHDLELTPVSSASVIPALTISVDKNQVKEGSKSTISVDYLNVSGSTLAEGEIKVIIPAGAVIVDVAGGTATGNTIVWKVTNLLGGQNGSYKVVIEWPLMQKADTAFDIPGEFTTKNETIKSSVKVNVFSDRFGELTHNRYILGYPDKEFKAEGSLTRAELAAIVARLTENEDINYSLSFSDIRAGHWATNYIKIAMKHNYFSGYEDGTFRPDAAVTRGELAAVMARFLKLEVSEPTSVHFTDTTGYWGADTLEALYNGKFLSGYPDGSFKPKNAIKRVEAVTMINRMVYRGPLKGLAPLFPDMPESHWGFGDVQEATISHKAERNEDGSETWIETISDDVQ
ncbi:S-layer homology domain-containing protein [Paenibacillus sp. FSL H8-0548]|uniref:S-layer homology domain-containing protein n=1 Tax=Paenibacillus sp. FSL H8-0548 TaxID=1920422 RepID=UPI0015C3DEBD|nr:S-layer homology domain-containing protein [Paenibacillus sp. FSL H8-0548]